MMKESEVAHYIIKLLDEHFSVSQKGLSSLINSNLINFMLARLEHTYAPCYEALI